MARPKGSTKIPSYRLHKASGQGVVTIDGRDYYLGPYGTDEGREAYDKLVGQWMVRGRGNPTAAASDEMTVGELIAAYVHYLRTEDPRADSKGGGIASYRSHFRVVRRLYGRAKVSEFGPLALRTVLDAMTKQPCEYKATVPEHRKVRDRTWSRKYINKGLWRVKAMFKWAESREIVPAGKFHQLCTVEPLDPNPNTVREKAPIEPVDERHVRACIALATPTMAAMLEVHLLTGMRPGEICIMRPVDIDMRGEVWVYRPSKHKTQRHGKERIVHLGPRCQELIRPLLPSNLHEFIFTPARSYWEGVNASKRPASKRAGSYKSNGKLALRDHYTTASYHEAVKRLARRADKLAQKNGTARVPHWHPHQLRHTAATMFRERYGLEAASLLLGHSDTKITEVYAKRDWQRAADIMREVG